MIKSVRSCKSPFETRCALAGHLATSVGEPIANRGVLLCRTSELASDVMSRMPNWTPIFLRNALGGSPPAKIHTKSFGISRAARLTSRTTALGLNSAGG